MFQPLIFLILAILASAEKTTFNDYKVFRITPKTNVQLDLLTELELQSENEYTFWRGPSYVNNTVDLMVAPENVPTLKRIMDKYNLSYKTYIENVQTLIDNENPNIRYREEGYSFDRYYRLEAMYQQLEVLEKQYAGKVKVVVGGETYEKRQIKGVKVSFGENKPVVVVEAGIHAREWIGPATAMYLLHQLLTSDNEEIRAMAEAHEWYIFPSVNPDGYEYSHTNYRLWRKTRSRHGSCYGVDANRNYNYSWMGQGGASSNPCSEIYGGSAPFSAVETRTFSEFLTKLQDRMFTYISFHSYSQLLLFPYGHTTEHLDNHDELYAIGKETIKALSRRYGTEYVTGNIAETIYIATGSSLDWVKGVLKVPVEYTYELRDTGRHGFLLPANQIVPNGEEVVDSLIALFAKAKEFGYPDSI